MRCTPARRSISPRAARRCTSRCARRCPIPSTPPTPPASPPPARCAASLPSRWPIRSSAWRVFATQCATAPGAARAASRSATSSTSASAARTSARSWPAKRSPSTRIRDCAATSCRTSIRKPSIAWSGGSIRRPRWRSSHRSRGTRWRPRATRRRCGAGSPTAASGTRTCATTWWASPPTSTRRLPSAWRQRRSSRSATGSAGAIRCGRRSACR